MSWTVSALCVWPLPDDPAYEPPPLGTGDEVRSRISAHLPGVDWSDPTWGLYAGDGFTFEFSVGPEEPLVSFAVHVRGGGDAIADLLRFAVPAGGTCWTGPPARPSTRRRRPPPAGTGGRRTGIRFASTTVQVVAPNPVASEFRAHDTPHPVRVDERDRTPREPERALRPKSGPYPRTRRARLVS